MMQQRIRKNDYLDLFDGPDGNVSLGDRKATTTTLQSLFLMNSVFIHDQAGKIADRVLRDASSPADRIQYAYRLVLGRAADEVEVRRVSEYLAVRPNKKDAWAGFVRSLVSSNEFMFVD